MVLATNLIAKSIKDCGLMKGLFFVGFLIVLLCETFKKAQIPALAELSSILYFLL
jgi:hypothetical protein